MDQKPSSISLEELAANITPDSLSYLLKLSHELKNPIHGIEGTSQYLNDNWESLNDEKRRDILGSILEASKSLSTLVESLFSRIGQSEQIRFKFVEMNLVQATQSIVKKYKDLHLHNKNIKIEFESLQDSLIADADVFWYGQLLTNLLSNAVNYSTQGTVSVKMISSELQGKPHCVVYVQDEGVGIPSSELKNIFKPFNRASKNNQYSKGTGLGLTICQEVVEAHGGAIKAYNNTEFGATVEFSIPLKVR